MTQPNYVMPKDIRDYMTPPRKRRIETDDDGSDSAHNTSQASPLPTSQAQAAHATPPPAAQEQDKKQRLLDSPAAERTNPVQNATKTDITVQPTISETHAGSSANPLVCHDTSSDDDDNIIEEQGIAVILHKPTAEQKQTSSPNTKSPTSNLLHVKAHRNLRPKRKSRVGNQVEAICENCKKRSKAAQPVTAEVVKNLTPMQNHCFQTLRNCTEHPSWVFATNHQHAIARALLKIFAQFVLGLLIF